VLASSLSVTGLTLRRTASTTTATEVFTLTAQSSTSSANGLEVVVNVHADDMNALKVLSTLAIDIDSTYLTIDAGSISDMALTANTVVGISVPSAKKARAYNADMTKPSLLNFDLDLTLEQLTLVFSETIRVSSFASQHITLQAVAGDSTLSYTFTAASSGTTSTDGLTIVASLSTPNLNALKTLRGLATQTSNTFISITSAMVSDMRGNSINAIATSSGKAVRTFTGDSVPPVLVGFSLSMDGAGLLVMTFSETMKASSLTPTGITIQNAATSTSLHTLTGGAFSMDASADSTTLSLVPAKADLDVLKHV
jgi:hypothetical protein